jgi:hypothetical protein
MSAFVIMPVLVLKNGIPSVLCGIQIKTSPLFPNRGKNKRVGSVQRSGYGV